MTTATLTIVPPTAIQEGDLLFITERNTARTGMHSDCFWGSRADAIAFGWRPSRSDAKRRRLKQRAKARFHAKRK